MTEWNEAGATAKTSSVSEACDTPSRLSDVGWCHVFCVCGPSFGSVSRTVGASQTPDACFFSRLLKWQRNESVNSGGYIPLVLTLYLI